MTDWTGVGERMQENVMDTAWVTSRQRAPNKRNSQSRGVLRGFTLFCLIMIIHVIDKEHATPIKREINR